MQVARFKGWIERLLEKMIKRLERIASSEDSIRIYALCAKCRETVKIFGKGKVTEDEDVYIV